jgi:hypothetical protein
MSLEPRVAALCRVRRARADLGARELVALAMVARRALGRRRSADVDAVEPVAHRDMVLRVLARDQLVPQLAHQRSNPRPRVLVDRLEVLLPGETKRRRELGEALDDAAIISRTQSSTKRGRRWAFSTTRPRRRASSARRSPRHRVLDDREQRWASMSVSQSSGSRCAACPRPRWLWVATGTASKMRSISSSPKPVVEQPLARARLHELCAHGHAVMPWRGTPTAAACRARATARPSSV